MAIESKEDLEAELKKYEKTTPPSKMKALRKAFDKMWDEDTPMKEALGVTPESEEALYSYAYQLFNSGKYKQAWGCFWFLRSLESTSYRYNFAIAACHQYMKQYHDAASTYLIASMIDPENPVPHFHMYECFLMLNRPQDALWCLENVIRRTESKPDYAPLFERASLEYKRLKKEVKE